MTSQFGCATYSASCFAICRTCWKVQALLLFGRLLLRSRNAILILVKPLNPDFFVGSNRLEDRHSGSHFNCNVHQYSLDGNISAESFPFLPEIFFVKDCIEEKNNTFCGCGKIIFRGK